MTNPDGQPQNIAEWRRTFFLAAVIVLSNAGLGLWLERRLMSMSDRGAAPGAAMQMPGGRAELPTADITAQAAVGDIATIDVADLDPELDAYVAELAAEYGLDPSQTPSAATIWSQMKASGLLESARTGDGARGALDVRGAMRAHVAELARTSSATLTPGGQPMPASGGGTPGMGPRGKETPAEVDQRLSTRLTSLAEQQEEDITELMPSQDVRDAAIASGSVESTQTRTMVDAYARSFELLGQPLPRPNRQGGGGPGGGAPGGPPSSGGEGAPLPSPGGAPVTP